MIKFVEFLDSASFILFAFIIYFLSSISKRLGDVMGLKKYYYLYYVGIFFVLFACIIAFPSDFMNEPDLFGYFFFSIGLTLSLIAAIRYWGWLIKEILRG